MPGQAQMALINLPRYFGTSACSMQARATRPARGHFLGRTGRSIIRTLLKRPALLSKTYHSNPGPTSDE